MPSFTLIIDSLLSSSVDIIAVLLLVILTPLLIAFTIRAREERHFPLRSIPVYETIRRLASQATETGYPIHVTLGTGRIGTEATPDSLMGLVVFDYVARNAAISNQPVQATAGDATLLAGAQGILQAARSEVGYPERYTGKEVSFYGATPLAYSAGTLTTLRDRRYLGNLFLGEFGPEGLWVAESVADRGFPQVGGAAGPESAALLSATLDETVVGEDVYAAGAYLHRPSHLGSLAAQDVLRVVLIFSIIVGVVLVSLGYWS